MQLKKMILNPFFFMLRYIKNIAKDRTESGELVGKNLQGGEYQ